MLAGDAEIPRFGADLAAAPLVRDLLPSFTEELHELLLESGEATLAAQIPALRMVDRCRCEDDFCAMFYVRAKPRGAYGSGHRNVSLEVERGVLILDICDEQIMAIEVLFRDDVREVVRRIFP